MNNKFIKRVAAVVLGVAVLSTCAFATTIVEADTKYTANDTVTFSYSAAGDKVSYIAYSVSGGEEKEIVAIGQIDDSAASDEISIPISASKLAYCEAIMLKTGDSNGNYDEYLVEEYTATSSTSTADVVIEGNTFTDLATITIEAKGKNPGKYTLAGLKATVGKETKTFATSVDGVAFPTVNVSDAGGDIALGNIYLVGLTEDQLDAAAINVVPDFTYSVN